MISRHDDGVAKKQLRPSQDPEAKNRLGEVRSTVRSTEYLYLRAEHSQYGVSYSSPGVVLIITIHRPS